MTDLTHTIDKVNRGIKAMQFIAGNPHLFQDGFEYHVWNSSIIVYVYDSYDKNGDAIDGSAKVNMANAIRTVRRAIPGSTTEKTYTDYEFIATISGPDFKVQFHTSRKKVCERVVTGTIEVEEIDYDKAPKKMVEKEIVEWRCDSILESA